MNFLSKSNLKRESSIKLLSFFPSNTYICMIRQILEARDNRRFSQMWELVEKFLKASPTATVEYDNSMWSEQELWDGAVGESYLNYVDEEGNPHHMLLWEAYN